MSSSVHLDLAAELISFGAGKGLAVPADEGLMASAVGGMVAGYSRCGEVGDLGSFLNTVAREIESCRMMAAEALEIFGSLGDPKRAAAFEGASDPLVFLAGLIVEHPKLHQLRSLFRVMPEQASQLGASVGVLLSLTMCRHQPRLADRVINSARSPAPSGAPSMCAPGPEQTTAGAKGQRLIVKHLFDSGWSEVSKDGQRILRSDVSAAEAQEHRPATTKNELVVRGEWSESPDHGGDLEFWVSYSDDRRTWELELVQLGADRSDDEAREEASQSDIVAVLSDNEVTEDDDRVVRLLMKAVQNSGEWPMYDGIREMGLFQLREGGPTFPRPIFPKSAPVEKQPATAKATTRGKTNAKKKKVTRATKSGTAGAVSTQRAATKKRKVAPGKTPLGRRR